LTQASTLTRKVRWARGQVVAHSFSHGSHHRPPMSSPFLFPLIFFRRTSTKHICGPYELPQKVTSFLRGLLAFSLPPPRASEWAPPSVPVPSASSQATSVFEVQFSPPYCHLHPALFFAHEAHPTKNTRYPFGKVVAMSPSCGKGLPLLLSGSRFPVRACGQQVVGAASGENL